MRFFLQALERSWPSLLHVPTVVAGADGSIAVKRQMQVNLTADHRVIYGADGAAFLKDLAELIESRPESLAL